MGRRRLRRICLTGRYREKKVVWSTHLDLRWTFFDSGPVAEARGVALHRSLEYDSLESGCIVGAPVLTIEEHWLWACC